MKDFSLNYRQQQVLGLVNDFYKLGISKLEECTLEGAKAICQAAKDKKYAGLHDLAIPFKILREIKEIADEWGRPTDDEDGAIYSFSDFFIEGMA